MNLCTSLPWLIQRPQPSIILQPPDESIWQSGVGEGFRATTQTIGLSGGAGYDLHILCGKERHDLGPWAVFPTGTCSGA